MIKSLNKIVEQINLEREVISVNEKVRPSVTIGDDGEVIALNPINIHNTFNSTGMKKLVILRYGIHKDFVSSLTNSWEVSDNFVKTIEKSVIETLNKLTNNNIKLFERITFKYPEQENNVLLTEDGNFELRVYCRVLL